MGSAFWCDNLGSDETVLFLMWLSDENADLICHVAHARCDNETPHRIHECGMFDPPREDFTGATQGDRSC